MFDFFKTKEKTQNSQVVAATALGLDPYLFEDLPEVEQEETGQSLALNASGNATSEELQLLKELEELRLDSTGSRPGPTIPNESAAYNELALQKYRLQEKRSAVSIPKTPSIGGNLHENNQTTQTFNLESIHELLREIPDEHEEGMELGLTEDPELLGQLELIINEMKSNDQKGSIEAVQLEEVVQANDGISQANRIISSEEKETPLKECREPLPDLDSSGKKEDLKANTTSSSEPSIVAPMDGRPDRNNDVDHPSIHTKHVHEQFMRRRNEYIDFALKYKRLGHINEAKKAYSIAKSLDAPIKLLESGKLVNLADLPSAPKNFSEKMMEPATGISLPRHANGNLVPSLSVSSTDSTMTFERMETLLKAQIIECDQLCRYHLLENRKEDALRFRKLAEFLKQDLEILNQAKLKRSELPVFNYIPINLAYKRIFSNIPSNELLIQIPQAINLQATKETGPLNTFLTCEFPYPGEFGTKFESSIVSSSDPLYNITKKILIERNRGFQRILERKKLTITISNSHRLFSLFPIGSLPYGYVSVDLQPLLTHCDIHEFAEILDSRKRPTGAKLEVKICMRSPLLKSEEVEETQRWLFISEPPESLIAYKPSKLTSSGQTDSTSPIKKKSQLPMKSQGKYPDSSMQMKATTSSASSKKPAQRVVEKPSSTNTLSPADERKVDPLDPDSAVSYRVLEWIIQMTESQIKSTGNKHTGSEELQERLLSAQTQLTLLTTQIQTGVLSMESYVKLLETRLSQDLSLMASLDRGRDLPLITLIQEKTKRIEDELREADQNN